MVRDVKKDPGSPKIEVLVLHATPVIAVPHGVPGRAERRHTIRDAIGNAQFDPIEGPHIVAQENAVAIIDQGQNRPNKQGDLD